jgi:uncharacterized protein YdhG (YjbR/CyaY superfamily)
MTVDDYLAELPDDARRVLQRIREAIRETAPDAEETISYRIPLYRLHGKHLIGFAGFKSHLSLFVMSSEALDRYENELAEFDQEGTKSTIRFTVDKPLPTPLVKRIVKTRSSEVSA